MKTRRLEVLEKLQEIKTTVCNNNLIILLMYVMEQNLSTTDLEVIEEELRKEVEKLYN